MKDELGNRMKEYYENRSKTYLVRRMPAVVRLDGRCFRSFTKGLKKPFDDILMHSMWNTMLDLCKNIQGCVFGYTQSDEITLVLKDYNKLNSDAWFDYSVQKLCSISASMSTFYFNKHFRNIVDEYWNQHQFNGESYTLASADKYMVTLVRCVEKGALFDSRCFNIPKEETTNCILWRQQDATRNSIQSVGQYYFSHKELNGKSCNDIQDMLFTQKGINWNDLPTYQKRGVCCQYKNGMWTLETEMPILVNEGRQFLEDIVNSTEE